MIFHETKLPGVFEIHLESKPDERGFFARTWGQSEMLSVVQDDGGAGTPRCEALHEDNMQRP
jgi:dTDP-4-dehydrorhamnose 3,5-epimerase-like enzyme